MSDKSSLVFSTEEIPIPRDRRGILDILALVLTKPYIQAVQLGTSGVMTVEWYKDPMDELLIETPDATADEMLARMKLEEVYSEEGMKAQLVDAYLRSMLEGTVPTFILTPNISKLRKSLDVPGILALPKHAITGRPRYLGMQLVQTESVPEGTLVICSAYIESHRLDAIVSGYKLFTE